MSLIVRSIALCAMTVAVGLPAVSGAEMYLSTPSVEDLDQALDPKCDRYRVENGLRRKCEVRGLTLRVAPKTRVEAATPSVSMPVLFAYDSAELTDEAKATLDKLGTVLSSDKYRTSRFRIVGHTDAAGSPEYNLDLSRRRAESATAYLNEKYRIEPQRLTVVGMGERKLLRPDAPLEAVNRRVEVVNEGDPVLSRAWQPGAVGDTNSGGWPSADPTGGNKVGG